MGGTPEMITGGARGLPGGGGGHRPAGCTRDRAGEDELHDRVSQAARRTAAGRFCADRIIPIYERYFEEVCGASLIDSGFSVSPLHSCLRFCRSAYASACSNTAILLIRGRLHERVGASN